MIAKQEQEAVTQTESAPAKEDIKGAVNAAVMGAVMEAVNEAVKDEPEAESSRMIFPTLEKESPASSTHDVTAPVTPAPAAVESVAASVSDSDIFEDAESVDFVDSSDEDGFNTDEEYDILDASDEELA